MTQPHPIVTVTYRTSGAAEVVAVWRARRVVARGRWSTRHAVWLPGVYVASHRVGLHGPDTLARPALVQQGRATMRVCDHSHHGGDLARATVETRRGWRGWNIHDDRGSLEGCIGLTPQAMLDVLGVCERARADGAEQHPDGGVFVTLRVEHRA